LYRWVTDSAEPMLLTTTPNTTTTTTTTTTVSSRSTWPAVQHWWYPTALSMPSLR